MSDDISARKVDHIDLCATSDVEYNAKTTLLEEVELLHDALPELRMDAISLKTTFLGRELRAPLLITGMTGGAAQATRINRELAEVAQELGLAFGVGSQRAILRDRSLAKTYQVRDIAPDVTLLGNIGGVQAAAMSTAEVQDLVDLIGANGMCVHLNPGQELNQPEGDRDFTGVLEAIGRLNEELQVPVIVKETGCGLSPRALTKLQSTGIQWVDVSGAGGTTWIGVEVLRTPAEKRTVGQMFWEWGVPTAAAVVWSKRRNFNTIASGGLRDGLDCARAIALGADMAGMALPWLRATHEGGSEAALKFGNETILALKTACLLTSSKDLQELREAPKIIGPKLRSWLDLA